MEFLGIINESEMNSIYNGTVIPNGATVMEGIDNLNIYFQIEITLVIFILLILINLMKIKKNNPKIKLKEIFKNEKLINKLQNEKNTFKIMKYVFGNLIKIPAILVGISILSIPIHEFIHAIFMFGHKVYIGFNPDYFICFALYTGSMSKWQNILALIAPFVLLGIIPFVILTISYPRKIKNKSKYLACVLCIICIMSTMIPDLIATYNIMKNVPNGAKIIDDTEETYWYIEK